LKAETIVAPR